MPATNDAFVVLPDSQFYACAFPNILRSQTDWIRSEQQALRIGAVLHTGDIVDTDSPDQWATAADALRSLDGHVPYLVTSGNHDIDRNRRSLMNQYLSTTQPATADCSRMGYMAEGATANSYLVTDLAGQPFLFIGLEFAPRDVALDWADDVLSRYADLPAVLFTHAYLYSADARYDRLAEPVQPFHPDLYQVTPQDGTADGQDIWEALVEPHKNIVMVMSGHVVPDGAAHRTVTRQSGSFVHEILANYQTCEYCPCAEAEGGGGYLRLLALDSDGTTLRVSTYSPHHRRWLESDAHAYTLQLDRSRR